MLVVFASLAILALGEATTSSVLTPQVLSSSIVPITTSSPLLPSTTFPPLSSILKEISFSQEGYNLFFTGLRKEGGLPLAVESNNASTECMPASSLLEEDGSSAGFVKDSASAMLSALETFFSFAFLSSIPSMIDSVRASSCRNVIEEGLPASFWDIAIFRYNADKVFSTEPSKRASRKARSKTKEAAKAVVVLQEKEAFNGISTRHQRAEKARLLAARNAPKTNYFVGACVFAQQVIDDVVTLVSSACRVAAARLQQVDWATLVYRMAVVMAIVAVGMIVKINTRQLKTLALQWRVLVRLLPSFKSVGLHLLVAVCYLVMLLPPWILQLLGHAIFASLHIIVHVVPFLWPFVATWKVGVCLLSMFFFPWAWCLLIKAVFFPVRMCVWVVQEICAILILFVELCVRCCVFMLCRAWLLFTTVVPIAMVVLVCLGAYVLNTVYHLGCKGVCVIGGEEEEDEEEEVEELFFHACADSLFYTEPLFFFFCLDSGLFTPIRDCLCMDDFPLFTMLEECDRILEECEEYDDDEEEEEEEVRVVGGAAGEVKKDVPVMGVTSAGAGEEEAAVPVNNDQDELEASEVAGDEEGGDGVGAEDGMEQKTRSRTASILSLWGGLKKRLSISG